MSRPPKHGDATIGSRTRLYDTWRGMRQRCNNPKASYYSIYGGQGIKVCSDWNVYANFKSWAVLNGYTDDLLIERRDNTKDYEPSNCYWANTTVQACNKRKRKDSRSSYIGVAPNRNNWQAYVFYERKRVHLGTYKTEEEAARIRDDYVKLHGLPHKLNF